MLSRKNQNHEELGSLKQEIKTPGIQRDSHAEYFQKAQLASEIYRAAEEMGGTEIEQDAVLRIRRSSNRITFQEP